MLQLKYYKISPEVPDLKFATDGSACFDLTAFLQEGVKVKSFVNYRHHEGASEIESTPWIYPLRAVIAPGERTLIPTGLIFDIPTGYELKVYVRGSTPLKKGLVLANSVGVVDEDYYHQTYLELLNVSDVNVSVNHGERLGQAQLRQTLKYELVKTDTPPTKKTQREGGFGSTGQS